MLTKFRFLRCVDSNGGMLMITDTTQKTGTAQKRSLSPSAPGQDAKKGKWQLEGDGDAMAFGLPRVMRSFNRH